jgi:hypothetical protein
MLAALSACVRSSPGSADGELGEDHLPVRIPHQPINAEANVLSFALPSGVPLAATVKRPLTCSPILGPWDMGESLLA